MMRVRAEMVLAALKELRPCTEQEISLHLDIPIADSKNRSQVSSRLRDLVKSGIAKECGEKDGLKLYDLGEGRPRRGDLQGKLWDAALLRTKRGQTLNASEAARMSGASREYARRCYHFWVAQGFLKVAGKTASKKFGTVPLYRVAPERLRQAPPRWQRRKEEAKKKGAGVGGQGLGADVAALAGAMRQGMREFAGAIRASVADHNDQVEQILQEMEADLERVARGELPEFSPGGLIPGQGGRGSKNTSWWRKRNPKMAGTKILWDGANRHKEARVCCANWRCFFRWDYRIAQVTKSTPTVVLWTAGGWLLPVRFCPFCGQAVEIERVSDAEVLACQEVSDGSKSGN